MATLSAVIVPSKAIKNGRHKVRFAVAHNGETRYILSDIILNSAREFHNGCVTRRPDAPALNTRIRKKLQEIQDMIYQIPYIEGLTCAELVTQIKNFGNGKGFPTLEESFIDYINSRKIKPHTKQLYEQYFRYIVQFIPRDTFIKDITRKQFIEFAKHLESKGLSTATSRSRLVMLKSLLIHAKNTGMATYKVDPFVSIKLPDTVVRQSWLSVQEIVRIRDAECISEQMSKFRDMFMLSYYLGGMNMIDMLKMDFRSASGVVKYERSKAEGRSRINKLVEFDMPEEALPLIDRLTGDDGFITATERERASCFNSMSTRQCVCMLSLLNLPYIMFYSARKSFAQQAFTLGVSTSVIDYILGHKIGTDKSINNHILVTPRMATKAERLVLDNLK